MVILDLDLQSFTGNNEDFSGEEMFLKLKVCLPFWYSKIWLF